MDVEHEGRGFVGLREVEVDDVSLVRAVADVGVRGPGIGRAVALLRQRRGRGQGADEDDEEGFGFHRGLG